MDGHGTKYLEEKVDAETDSRRNRWTPAWKNMGGGTRGNIKKERVSVGHNRTEGEKDGQMEGHVDKWTDAITDTMVQGQTDRHVNKRSA